MFQKCHNFNSASLLRRKQATNRGGEGEVEPMKIASVLIFHLLPLNSPATLVSSHFSAQTSGCAQKYCDRIETLDHFFSRTKPTLRGKALSLLAALPVTM